MDVLNRSTRQIKLFILALILNLPLLNVQAASLEVLVSEKGTGDAIQDATVVINNKSFDTSDTDGRVRFEDISFPLSVKVLATGFVSIEETINHSKSKHKIFIEPEQYTAETLEVTAERITEKTSKVALSTEELKRAPGSQGDPLKVIQNLPGVVSAGPQILVRGSNANQNQAWINNMRVDYLFHWTDIMGISSVVNPDLVKDFNIFLGGFPVEYSDGLGGFFDVQLRKPKDNRINQTYRLGMNESAMLIEGPINKSQGTSFYIAARKSYLDVLLTPSVINKILPNSVRILTLPNYYDAQASIVRKTGIETIDLSYFTAGDNISIINTSGEELDPESAGNLEIDVGFENLGLSYFRQHKQNLQISSIKEYRVQREKQIIGQDQNGEPFKVDGRYWQLGWHPSVSWQSNKNSNWRYGSEFVYAVYPINLYLPSFNESGPSANSFTLAPKVRVIHTVKAAAFNPYVKFRKTWNNRLTTITGLRYSGIEGTDEISIHGLMPRATLEYQAATKLMLTASWGRYLQMPEESTLLKDFGNPQLEFIEAEHRIAGIHLQVHKNWKLQTEAWQKPMRRLLTRTGLDAPENYKNAGTGNAHGLDLLLKRQSSERKFGWVSYSYSHSERTNTLTNETVLFSGDQPHTFTLIWGQPFPKPVSKWEWGIKIQVRSGKPHTPVTGVTAYCLDNSDILPCTVQPAPGTDLDKNCDPASTECLYFWQPEFGETNSKRLPVYYKVDFRIDRKYRFNTWHMSIYADIQNVSATANVFGYDYGKNYSEFSNPKEITGLAFPLPFLGIEAHF